jgi:glycosyltransferase involved in cell wall biosynthesis
MGNKLLFSDISKVSIVIPAYEPNENLINLVEQAFYAGYNIIVVNDGSSAECAGIWRQIGLYATVLHHTVNHGKGAALKTAFTYLKYAIPRPDFIVTMDADGQHLLSDLLGLLQKLRQTDQTLVLGSRSFDLDIPLKSKLGNKITREFFLFLSHTKVNDTQTGFRAFRFDMLPFMLSVEGKKYEYEMNVLLNCGKQGIKIAEVPINTVYLDKKNSCSHFNGFRDSFLIYKNILKFASSSLISFCADYLLFLLFMIILPDTSGFVLLGNIAARFFSASLNYMLNLKAVFKGTQTMSKTLPQYICLACGILAGNNFILFFLTDIVGILPVFAKVVTEMLLFIISFSVQSLYIFRKSNNV